MLSLLFCFDSLIFNIFNADCLFCWNAVRCLSSSVRSILSFLSFGLCVVASWNA